MTFLIAGVGSQAQCTEEKHKSTDRIEYEGEIHKRAKEV